MAKLDSSLPVNAVTSKQVSVFLVYYKKFKIMNCHVPLIQIVIPISHKVQHLNKHKSIYLRILQTKLHLLWSSSYMLF